MGWWDRGVEVKTPEQIATMRVAGLLTAGALAAVRAGVRPGVSTAELDAIAEDHIRGGGGVPSFKGYADPPYPATICASVNDVVVHGIPDDRPLAAGDLLSVDCGAIVDGWHGDSAITVVVGGDDATTPERRRLIDVAESAMWAGIAAIRPGGRVSDVSAAVEASVRAAGDYGILKDFTGHGIGTAMHQPPDVPNYGRSNRTPLRVGMALAIEPMLTLGSAEWTVDDDDWTVRSEDGSWAAHVEHTVAITERGLWVLTAVDGGRAALGTAYAGA